MNRPTVYRDGLVASIIAAVILLIVFVFGLKEIIQRSPTKWVYVYPHETSEGATPKINILNNLPQTLPESGIPPRALVTFIKNNGQPLTVHLLTARLTNDSFAGQPDWKIVTNHLLILNSVDEAQSIDGGISGPIGNGCNLIEANRQTLNIGDVDFHKCTGAYYKNFGVDKVANVAIVVGVNSYSEKRPCWNPEGVNNELKYQICVKEDTSNAIVNFMDQLHNIKDVNGIIVPAVGTGTGGLAKSEFYSLLFSRLLLILNDTDASTNFPNEVYLLVNPSDTTAVWGQTRNAIATSLGRAATSWKNAEHKSSTSEWAPLVGVAGGAACFLLLSGFGWLPSWMHNDARVLQENFSPLFFLAWLASAIGLATATKTFVSIFSTYYWTPWLLMTTGIAVVFLAGPLLRAADAVKKPPQKN